MVRLVATVLGLAAFGIASPSRAAEIVIPLQGEVPRGGPDHFFVEFDVPADMNVVEIEVRHDDLSADNILDFGLDDPAGFRGWGGGNTEPAIVGIDAASRSYVPGPIAAGTWRVVIGKAKIVDPPGQWQLEIVLRDEPTLAPQRQRQPYVAPAPLSDAARWYAGDFHVHSDESGDASATLDEILDLAAARGLDFVEISDHNVHTASDFFNAVQARHPDTLLLPGVEYTTYAGHANGIGALAWVDHKIGQRGVTIEAAAAAYRDAGALFSIMHPTLALGDLCIGCGWEHRLPASSIDAVEIASGGLMPIGGALVPGAIAFWDALCDEGAHVAALGGSDDHRAGIDLGPLHSPIGDPTTMVYATSLEPAAILEGIRAGRTVVKLQGPDDAMVELWPADPLDGDTVVADTTTLVATVTGGIGQSVRLVHDGRPGAPVDITEDPFEIAWDVTAPDEGEARYRVEVLMGTQRRVVTSHVWLRADATPPPGGTDDGTADSSGSAGPGGDAEPDPDPITTDAGTTSGAPADEPDSGCSCRTGDRSPIVTLFVVAWFAVRRRRWA